MSRLSQCATCDRGRCNCGHYTPEDDTECPHYLHDRVQENEEPVTVWDLLYVCITVLAIVAAVIYQIYIFEPRILIPIAAVVVIVSIYWIIRKLKNKIHMKKMGAMKESVMNEKGDNNDIPLSRMTTRNLIQLALRKLGITYDFDENNAFRITYQGEHLIIDAKDDSVWITIYDVWWYDAPMDDIENMNLVLRAINDYNRFGDVKLIYSFDDERGKIGVHAIMNAIFVEQIPNWDQLLRAYMDEVLASHQHLYNIMEHLRRQAHSSQE